MPVPLSDTIDLKQRSDVATDAIIGIVAIILACSADELDILRLATAGLLGVIGSVFHQPSPPGNSRTKYFIIYITFAFTLPVR